MPRNSRVVAVGYPHHITQRGNNREPVFFDDDDRFVYLDLLSHYTQKYQVDVWAYCLMTNHIHLLSAPNDPDGLSHRVGLTNMTYTQHVNRKYTRSGRIWQNRFFSSVVDTGLNSGDTILNCTIVKYCVPETPTFRKLVEC